MERTLESIDGKQGETVYTKENQNNETNPNEDDGENGSREDTEKKCTIEEALEQSGSCGRFQIFLQILATYLVLVIAYTPSFSYFTLDDPPWRCVVHHNHNHSNNNNNDDSHSSSSFCLQTINSTQPVTFDADSKFFNMRCTLPRDEWEYTTSKGYSAVTEWDLVCNHASWNALCNAMVFIGGLFGAALCGNWSDRYGRRPVMLGTLSMNALSSIACTFVSNVWQLMGLRFLIGASYIACFNTSLVYLMEFVAPRYRTISGIVAQVTYCGSLLLSDAMAYHLKDWRQLHFFCSLPSILAFVAYIFVPESPRWLLSVKRLDKAKDVLLKLARYAKLVFECLRS